MQLTSWFLTCNPSAGSVPKQERVCSMSGHIKSPRRKKQKVTGVYRCLFSSNAVKLMLHYTVFGSEKMVPGDPVLHLRDVKGFAQEQQFVFKNYEPQAGGLRLHCFFLMDCFSSAP